MENNRSKKETVGTSLVVLSEEVQATNGERVLIRYTNTSTGGQTITLGIDAQAEDGKGIVLFPGGFHLESKDSKDHNIVTQKRITAIADAAGGTLACYERVVQ